MSSKSLNVFKNVARGGFFSSHRGMLQLSCFNVMDGHQRHHLRMTTSSNRSYHNLSRRWNDSYGSTTSSCATTRSYLHTSNILGDSFKIQDEDDFNTRVLKSSKPVVVQFHATWCGPCKQLSPRMEKSIAATKDAVDLAQVDIDDNPDIAMSYSVGAVPAVMAVKDGKVVDKFVGLKDEDQVDTFVAKLVK